MAARFVTIDRDTPLLLPPDLRDWVPADHLAHFFDSEWMFGLQSGTGNPACASTTTAQTRLSGPHSGPFDIVITQRTATPAEAGANVRALTWKWKNPDGKEGYWMQANGFYTFPAVLRDIRSYPAKESKKSFSRLG